MSTTPSTCGPGDRVRLLDGPLSNFEGVVREVDANRARLNLAVSVKGQSVPILVEAWQVEKLA